MNAPHTFVYEVNRNGVPWRATEYICRHGYESATCGVEIGCPQVGEMMLDWWNDLPSQWRAREVVRTGMLNG